ncbi:MAG: hypothetical protein HYV60_19025 [Planctomycetia bacterium]|nr:hypothetical protein [Planctomycetia bacterium]
MRAFNTINSLPKHSLRLTALVMMPLLLSMWMLSLTKTSRAEEGMEEPPLALEITYFSFAEDPFENTVELFGQIQAENPEGLTVTFSGDVTGSVQTYSDGSFNFFVFGQSIAGDVTATVSNGTETSSTGFNG